MKKNIRNYLTGFVLVSTILCSITGCASRTEPAKQPLAVNFLRVGKADAIVALSGNHALLIDTGEEDDGEEVVEFLQKHSVSEVDAMIITHFDQDHVGGADTVLEEFDVKDVYVPAYTGTHEEYFDFQEALKKSSASVYSLTESTSFTFGDAEVLVEPPVSYEIPEPDSDYDNNFSLITTITHGNNRLVFMGDAEKQRIQEWLKGDSAVTCDFLKVPHHGIYNRALKDLFKQLDPKISVICSSRKNPAESKTLEELHKWCPSIYETKDGDVMVLSDGVHLESSQKIKK